MRTYQDQADLWAYLGGQGMCVWGGGNDRLDDVNRYAEAQSSVGGIIPWVWVLCSVRVAEARSEQECTFILSLL